MTALPRSCSSRHGLTRPAAAALLALAASSAGAASLNVTLVDSVGRPLVDAVALLEPATGKATVKPMPDVELAQAKRRFQPRVTLITLGTRVNFPNFDTVRHHVYSFSAVNTFELKLYAGVPNAPLTFDKPGIAVLGCNIHDSMAAWIVVADTPWSGRSAANGRVHVDNVPPGAYLLRLWHPGFVPGTEPAPIPLVVGAADVERNERLNIAGDP